MRGKLFHPVGGRLFVHVISASLPWSRRRKNETLPGVRDQVDIAVGGMSGQVLRHFDGADHIEAPLHFEDLALQIKPSYSDAPANTCIHPRRCTLKSEYLAVSYLQRFEQVSSAATNVHYRFWSEVVHDARSHRPSGVTGMILDHVAKVFRVVNEVMGSIRFDEFAESSASQKLRDQTAVDPKEEVEDARQCGADPGRDTRSGNVFRLYAETPILCVRMIAF